MPWWSWLVIGVGVLIASWMLLVLLAARLPEGSLKELAGFLPDCVTTARRLRRDPRVPRRAKVAIGFALLSLLSRSATRPDKFHARSCSKLGPGRHRRSSDCSAPSARTGASRQGDPTM